MPNTFIVCWYDDNGLDQQSVVMCETAAEAVNYAWLNAYGENLPEALAADMVTAPVGEVIEKHSQCDLTVHQLKHDYHRQPLDAVNHAWPVVAWRSEMLPLMAYIEKL